MTQSTLEEIMEILEVDLSSKRMEVLKALIHAENEIGAFVELPKIKAELEASTDGKSVDRSLIHRQLKSLVRDGYVRADKGGYRHRYTTDIGILAKVFEKKISQCETSLDQEIKRIDKDLQAFTQMESSELGKSLIELMSGSKTEDRPHFSTGIDGLLRIFRSELFSKARRGEVIKATVDWLDLETDLSADRLSWMSDLVDRGVKLRVLGQFRPTKAIQRRMRKYYDIAQILGFDVDYRIRTLKRATYQFIGIARIGIVLVVSENPMAVTWIPKASNPLLIAQAMATFDRDFKDAEPVGTIFGSSR
ncbi:MAG: hypothetical protein EAX95_08385 [Candidatus Thorarchaeota archaeon]|nr:hypothetical protein [Candidatus Thorarchaeota archaeon]